MAPTGVDCGFKSSDYVKTTSVPCKPAAVWYDWSTNIGPKRRKLPSPVACRIWMCPEGRDEGQDDTWLPMSCVDTRESSQSWREDAKADSVRARHLIFWIVFSMKNGVLFVVSKLWTESRHGSEIVWAKSQQCHHEPVKKKKKNHKDPTFFLLRVYLYLTLSVILSSPKHVMNC